MTQNWREDTPDKDCVTIPRFEKYKKMNPSSPVLLSLLRTIIVQFHRSQWPNGLCPIIGRPTSSCPTKARRDAERDGGYQYTHCRRKDVDFKKFRSIRFHHHTRPLWTKQLHHSNKSKVMAMMEVEDSDYGVRWEEGERASGPMREI